MTASSPASTESAARTGGRAAMVMGARLGGAAANVAVVLLLSRTLSPEEVGLILAALAVSIVAEALATFGREGTAVQVLPHALRCDRPQASAYLRSLAVRIAWRAPLAGLAAAGVLALITGAATPGVLLATALLVPVATSLRGVARCAAAAGKPAVSAGCQALLRPALMLALVFCLSRLGALGPESALWAAVAAAAASLAVQAVLSARVLSAWREAPGAADPAWGRDGAALLLTLLLTAELTSVVTLVGGVVLHEAALAALGVALRITALAQLGTMALVAVVGPRLSAAWGRGDRGEAQVLGQAVTLAAGPAALAVTLSVWALAPWLLGLFDPAYVSGAWALRLLVLIPLAAAVTGPNLLALTVSGHARAASLAALLGAAGLALGLPLGALFGTTGVAAGAALGASSWYVLLAIMLRRREGLALDLPAALRSPAARRGLRALRRRRPPSTGSPPAGSAGTARSR